MFTVIRTAATIWSLPTSAHPYAVHLQSSLANTNKSPGQDFTIGNLCVVSASVLCAPGFVHHISDVNLDLRSVIQARRQNMYPSIFDVNINATSAGLLPTFNQMDMRPWPYNLTELKWSGTESNRFSNFGASSYSGSFFLLSATQI
ncbi:hypothetical protein CY34DRAFT_812324 [Suillus luteus UH-Slu-Lm8-n1]|uniref:Uncharacterized protein n=1 Tax=Suillus luteus UH-Slu-Lm8-n1 TaxID=930992 RepID=A0A0D0A083_9AGAM|nr:hypothetical protein CY34DRAFT_812324 [Suillus luteus UH-Slu-Lm8-n1]